MSDSKNYSEEENLKKYAEQIESSGDEKKVTEIKSNPLPIDRNQPQVESQETVGKTIGDTTNVPKPWLKDDSHVKLQDEIGWQRIPIETLPTKGLFYPVGTEVLIRAAIGDEIRHWSTLNEEDMARLDDMLNYVLERCCSIKYPNEKHSSWKDIKEIDRFYIILAIRELTFINSGNKLQVKVSENKKVDVVKEMIDYITIDERLMKYYDTQQRNFNLKFKDGSNIRFTLPSVGITSFLKNYVIRKRQMQEPIDEDFVNFAPFVILDWRGLNDDSYSHYVLESGDWNVAQISVLDEIKRIFADAVRPVVRYKDEIGGERTVPLNFQGGIKSLFLISNPFGELV